MRYIKSIILLSVLIFLAGCSKRADADKSVSLGLKTFYKSAREIPIIAQPDVLVIGAGSVGIGTAAAMAPKAVITILSKSN